MYISIHAPVKGATRIGEGLKVREIYFNPRTREGCDERRKISSFDNPRFQSTHP